MSNTAGKVSGTEKSTNGAPPAVPPVPMLTRSEAAKRLGMTVRHFLRIRAKIPGGVPGAAMIPGPHGPEWAFPVEAIDALANRITDEDMNEEPPINTVDDGGAALLREVVAASKVVHATATEALTAAVACVKGTDSRTAHFLEELARQGKALGEAQTLSLEAVKLVRDLIVEQGRMEADSIKSQADQTIRVERTKVAARGMNLFGPIIKKGFAHALGAPALAQDAQGETVAAVMEDLAKDGKLELIGEVLDDPQKDAIESLLAYVEGRGKLGAALRILKEGMTPEKLVKLAPLLTERQQTAIASLFEHADEPEEPKEAK